MDWLWVVGRLAIVVMTVASISLAAVSAVQLRRKLSIHRAFVESVSHRYVQKRHRDELQKLLAHLEGNHGLSPKELRAFRAHADEILRQLPKKEAEVIASGLNQGSEEGRARYARRVILDAGSVSHSDTQAVA